MPAGASGTVPLEQEEAELLGGDLKGFLRIEGEPVVLTEDGEGWRTVFGILGEG
jgi:hypothetical protein